MDTESDRIAQYKRDGHFDSQRRVLLDQFAALESQLEPLVADLVQNAIEMDPSIVTRTNAKLGAIVKSRLLQYAKQAADKPAFFPAGQEESSPLQRERQLLAQIHTLIESYVQSSVYSNEELLTAILARLD